MSDLMRVPVYAIENGFPLELISQLAEGESWRKEIYRPPYYLHKWWARRLGSVFRAIVLACCLDKTQAVETFFYQPATFPDVVIFDPFMGSGVTVGEAAKLGCRVIGRDINPVAAGMVTAALQPCSRPAVRETFAQLRETVADRILSFYKTRLSDGTEADVLYYFWVKVVNCPLCGEEVELFKNRIFASHTNPRAHPQAQALCSQCGAVNPVLYTATTTSCDGCGHRYNPQIGAVKQTTTTCPACQANFKVIEAVRQTASPPQHKMYAKLVLTHRGEKLYLPVDEGDYTSYTRAEALLTELWADIPPETIAPGYNTDQILNYNYTHWHQMFNARQLAAAALLSAAIRQIAQPQLRLLFAYLFSGTLEFNNMFCSFKGEGTGAVRHLFAHHILKPELTPIEANLWGTPKSSGAFSMLFETRVMRLLDYKAAPFELELVGSNGNRQGSKVYGLSQNLDREVVTSYQAFAANHQALYLACGDSAQTDIPDETVDFVITDPPFFDNVHYSQLADFFYVWLRQIMGENGLFEKPTTRAAQEVQDTEAEHFTTKLSAVFRECQRVLKPAGLLVFTYHHARLEGWQAVYKAVREAGFRMTHAHPVKAEMAVAVPLRQAKTPVHFDLIMVCRKRTFFEGAESQSEKPDNAPFPLPRCFEEALHTVNRLRAAGIAIGLGDAKVILMGKILTRLWMYQNLAEEMAMIARFEDEVDQYAAALLREISVDSEANDALLTEDLMVGTLPVQTSFW